MLERYHAFRRRQKAYAALRGALDRFDPQPRTSWPLTIMTWLAIAALIKYLV